MPKETRLDDNAQIYNPRSQQTEREKLREMKTIREKLAYLWEYYKLFAIGTVVIIAIVIYFVYEATHPSPTVKLYAAVINNTINPELLEEYQTDFSDYLKMDPKKESVTINSSYVFNGDTSYAMNMEQALATYIQAGEIDVIIAPESEFYRYTYHGISDKLSEQLPTDVYSSLTDYFYQCDTEDNSEKEVYGIYLTNTKLFKENADNSEPYIIGILPNSKHKANAVEFIRYLFNEK